MADSRIPGRITTIGMIKTMFFYSAFTFTPSFLHPFIAVFHIIERERLCKH